MTEVRLRLALDQNFPTNLIEAVRDFLPRDMEYTHVHKIDPRLSDCSDRQLLIALRQLGYDGLITNNYRMLNQPREIAAMVATKAVMVIVEKLGDDPIRAAGALLLELPGLPDRVLKDRASIFSLRYAARRPTDAWEVLRLAAQRRYIDVQELWADVQVSDQERDTAVLID